MKIYSLIFGLLLLILGICSTVGVLLGATHQLVVAVPAIIIAYALLREAAQKEKPKRLAINRAE